jgi:hypothetical protein
VLIISGCKHYFVPEHSMTQIVFLVLPPFQNVGRIRILYVKCAKDTLIDSYSTGFLVRYWFAVIDNILYRKLVVKVYLRRLSQIIIHERNRGSISGVFP